MKTYIEEDLLSDDAAAYQRPIKRESRPMYPESDSLAKVAFEWNNALLVAARNLWGDAELPEEVRPEKEDLH
jgi:hypothetical protein